MKPFRGLRLLVQFIAAEFRRDTTGLRSGRTPSPASMIVLMLIGAALAVPFGGLNAASWGLTVGALTFSAWNLRTGVLRPVSSVYFRYPTRLAYRNAGAGWDASTVGWLRDSGLTPDHVRILVAAGYTDALHTAALDLLDGKYDPDHATAVLAALGPEFYGQSGNSWPLAKNLLALPPQDGLALAKSDWSSKDMRRLLDADIPVPFALAWRNHISDSTPSCVDTWMLCESQGLSVDNACAWITAGPATVLAMRQTFAPRRSGPPPRVDNPDAVRALRTWNDLLGPDAPAWFSAGLSLTEVQELLNSGQPLDHDTMAAFAALRAPADQ